MKVENRWMIQLRSKIELKNGNSNLQFLFNSSVSKLSEDTLK